MRGGLGVKDTKYYGIAKLKTHKSVSQLWSERTAYYYFTDRPPLKLERRMWRKGIAAALLALIRTYVQYFYLILHVYAKGLSLKKYVRTYVHDMHMNECRASRSPAERR